MLSLTSVALCTSLLIVAVMAVGTGGAAVETTTADQAELHSDLEIWLLLNDASIEKVAYKVRYNRGTSLPPHDVTP